MVTAIRKGARSHLYIIEHMEALGLNDEKLGGRMGTSRTTVWRWRQKRNLGMATAAQIADAMGLTLQELMQPPTRPSVDAKLRGQDDQTVAKAAQMIDIWLGKTG